MTVRWGPWERNRTLMCPPPPVEPCPDCGSTEPRILAHGWTYGARRTGPGTVVSLARHPHHLYAYRCTGCAHDQVFDGTDLFDLDPDDYNDTGSHLNPPGDPTWT